MAPSSRQENDRYLRAMVSRTRGVRISYPTAACKISFAASVRLARFLCETVNPRSQGITTGNFSYYLDPPCNSYSLKRRKSNQLLS